MASPPPEDPNCILEPLQCVGDAVVNSAMGNLAEGLREGAKELIENSVGWWIKADSIDLATSPAADIRQWTVGLAMLVALGGALWIILQVAWKKSGEGVVNGMGVFARLAIVLAATAPGPDGGFQILQSLMNGIDDMAEQILDEAVTDRIVDMATMTGIESPGLIIALALLLMVVGAIQALLMVLREGAIAILAGLLVLAAAGGAAPLTRGWWPKLTGTLMALIWYKLAAALVWGTTLSWFSGAGETENPIMSFIIGLTMFGLSIFALGPMTKFFSWGSASMAAGGGGGMLAAMGMGAYAMSQGGGTARGPSASEHASQLATDMGRPTGAVSGGGGGASGAATAASGAGTAATGAATAGAGHAVILGIQGGRAIKDTAVGAMGGES